MTTLNDILVKEKEIQELAKKFGFSEEVKIYNDNSSDDSEFNLNFVVSKIPGQSISYKNSSFLQAKLTEILDCKVNIIVSENISELYRYHYDNKSAPLSDNEAVFKLFGQVSSAVVFNKLDGNDKEMQEILLKSANEHLKKKSSNSTYLEGYGQHALLGSPTQSHLKRKREEFSSTENSGEIQDIKIQFDATNRSVTLNFYLPEGIEFSENTLINPDVAKEVIAAYLLSIKAHDIPGTKNTA